MNSYYVLDQKRYPSDQAFQPFALTDVLITFVGEKEQPFLHFWQLQDTVILGMKDTRVTDLKAGLKQLLADGYPPIVRNSGGLGVIADEGILNISLIFPNHAHDQSTDTTYQRMYELTQRAFPELKIETGEISDSYCPGTFDLSVNGQKIAGIAQRRVQNGIAVMMYLSVNGDQNKRGEIVRAFYQAGLGGEFGTQGFPPVNPNSMTTVAQLLGKPLTVSQVKDRFLQSITSNGQEISSDWLKNQQQLDLFRQKLEKMIQRNQTIKELIYDDTL